MQLPRTKVTIQSLPTTPPRSRRGGVVCARRGEKKAIDITREISRQVTKLSAELIDKTDDDGDAHSPSPIYTSLVPPAAAAAAAAVAVLAVAAHDEPGASAVAAVFAAAVHVDAGAAVAAVCAVVHVNADAAASVVSAVVHADAGAAAGAVAGAAAGAVAGAASAPEEVKIDTEETVVRWCVALKRHCARRRVRLTLAQACCRANDRFEARRPGEPMQPETLRRRIRGVSGVPWSLVGTAADEGAADEGAGDPTVEAAARGL